MQVMHVSDLHVGARPFGMEERYLDVVEAFREVVDIALRERPSWLIISGDLFDKPKPDNRDFREVYQGLKRVIDSGIRIIAAHGEHDTPSRRDITMLQVLESILSPGMLAPLPSSPASLEDVARSQVVELGDASFIVYPFSRAPLDQRKELARRLLKLLGGRAASLARPRIFVGHFSLDTVFPLDALASPSQLPPVEYAAMGHLHDPYIGSCGDGSCPPYAYPGSLECITEADSVTGRGPLLVDLSGGEPSIDRVALESLRPQALVRVEVKGDVREVEPPVRGAVLRLGPGGGKKPFLRIHVRASRRAVQSPRLLEARIRRLQESLGFLYRLRLEYVDEGEQHVPVPEAGSRRDIHAEVLASVISGLMGLKRADRSLGEVLEELRDAAISRDWGRVDELLEEVMRRSRGGPPG